MISYLLIAQDNRLSGCAEPPNYVGEKRKTLAGQPPAVTAALTASQPSSVGVRAMVDGCDIVVARS